MLEEVDSSNQDELCKELEKIFKEASAYRKQYEEEWKENEDFYKGKQWKLTQKRPVKNYCFMIIEAEVPILVSSKPGTDIIPSEETEASFEGAKILESAVKYTYDQQSLPLKLIGITRSHLKTGTSFLYVDYDPDLENGEGGITIKQIPWRFVYFDPSGSEIDECSYVIIKFPMRISEIKRRYGEDSVSDIKPEYISSEDGEMTNLGLDPNKWHPANLAGQSEKDRYALEDMAYYEEFWVKDYSMEKVPYEETTQEIAREADQFTQGINPDVHKYEDHDAHYEAHEQFKYLFASQLLQILPEMVTEQDIEMLKQDPQAGIVFLMIEDHQRMHEEYKKINPEGLKPKYPYNLRLTIKCQKNILYDGPMPVEDGIVPVVPFYCYKDEEIYGEGAIKNIKPIQKSINEMDWAELQGLRLNGNSGWIMDVESGVEEDTLTNEPGIVVKKHQGTEVSRLPPGQVSPQITERKVMDVTAMEQIEGMNEASQGRRPTGITAARAVEAIQAQALGRARLKAQYTEDYSMLRLGKLTASRVQKYWSTERKLRLYDANGKIKYIQYSPDAVRDLKYEVKIVPGTTMGQDKESIYNVSKDLLQLGVLSPKSFVEVNDLPYRNRIIEDIEQRDELTAQAQALAMENEQLKQALAQYLGNQPGSEIPPTQ